MNKEIKKLKKMHSIQLKKDLLNLKKKKKVIKNNQSNKQNVIVNITKRVYKKNAATPQKQQQQQAPQYIFSQPTSTPEPINYSLIQSFLNKPQAMNQPEIMEVKPLKIKEQIIEPIIKEDIIEVKNKRVGSSKPMMVDEPIDYKKMIIDRENLTGAIIGLNENLKKNIAEIPKPIKPIEYQPKPGEFKQVSEKPIAEPIFNEPIELIGQRVPKPGYVFNPETKREIVIGGSKYKKLFDKKGNLKQKKVSKKATKN